jgi:hypothetical protein
MEFLIWHVVGICYHIIIANMCIQTLFITEIPHNMLDIRDNNLPGPLCHWDSNGHTTNSNGGCYRKSYLSVHKDKECD